MIIVKFTYIKAVLCLYCFTHLNDLTHCINLQNTNIDNNPLGIGRRRILFIRSPNYRSYKGGFSGNKEYWDSDHSDSITNLESINEYRRLKARNRNSNQNEDFVDYYKILSLDKECSPDEIEDKYKHINETLSTLPGVDPKLRSEVDTAYNVLSNEKTRNEYDKTYESHANSEDEYDFTTNQESMPEEFDDDDMSEELEISIINDDETPDFGLGSNLFGNFFTNLFGVNKSPTERKMLKTRSNPRYDVSCTADLDLKTLLLGGNVSVTVRKWDDCNFCNFNDSATQSYIDKCSRCKGKGMEHKEKRSPFGFMRTSRTCMSCQGTGYSRLKDCNKCENTGRVLKDSTVKVNVPFNSKVGSVIRIKGKGHSGGFRTRDGDLYVKLKLKENKNEYMEGGRIVTVYNLPYTKAILGGKFKVNTFMGEKDVIVPRYSQQGEEIKVGTYKDMEHYVKLNVQLPKNLSKDDLEMLNKIDKS